MSGSKHVAHPAVTVPFPAHPGVWTDPSRPSHAGIHQDVGKNKLSRKLPWYTCTDSSPYAYPKLGLLFVSTGPSSQPALAFPVLAFASCQARFPVPTVTVPTTCHIPFFNSPNPISKNRKPKRTGLKESSRGSRISKGWRWVTRPRHPSGHQHSLGRSLPLDTGLISSLPFQNCAA